MASSGSRELSQEPTPETASVKDQVRQRAYELYEQRGGAAGHDLEDWLRAEGATLEEAINAFDTIFEQLPVGGLVADRRGKLLLANREAKRLLGAAAKEVLLAEWVAVFGWYLPDKETPFPAEQMPLSRALRGEEVVEELAFLRNPQQPAGAWVRASSRPIVDSQGKARGAVVVLRDVTELRKEHEREVQLQLARKVQQRLFPNLPALPGLEVGAASHAADETGGDYLDFIPMPGGRLGAVVGDVSRHGLGSALVMAMTRAYVRAYASVEADPGLVLTRVNRMLVDDLDHTVEDRWYATLLLVCVDPGSRSMVYASAGHVPGLVIDDSGKVERVLPSMGLPLGLFPGTAYSSSDLIPLKAQQAIVLLTDGILDARTPDGSYFGMERTVEHIRAHQQESAQEIVESLYWAARAFLAGGTQEDDMAFTVVKVNLASPAARP